MSKLDERIIKAVLLDDASAVGRIADMLRFRWGMTYRETFERFSKAEPSLLLSDFEDFLLEAEHLESSFNG